MRTKALQDLADRMPEVAATGLEQVRRGGRIVAERAPGLIDEGRTRLSDLAERAPSLMDEGRSRLSDLAERAPVVVGGGVNRLTDLADRAGVPVPARLEAIGRPKPRSRTAPRNGLLAIAAGAAVLLLVKVARKRRAATAEEIEPEQAAEDRNSMPPYTRVAGPRSASEAGTPGGRQR